MATFGDLEAYLKRAPGWVRVSSRARGRRAQGDHTRYTRELPDGTTIGTKVSHHRHEEIGPDLFRRILRDQLHVSEEAFWAMVRGRGTDRTPEAAGARSPDARGVPAWLVEYLIKIVGLAESDVLAMTAEEAQATWDDYRSKPPG